MRLTEALILTIIVALTAAGCGKPPAAQHVESGEPTEWDRRAEVAATWVRDAEVVVETVAVPTGSVRVVRPTAASQTNVVVLLQELEAAIGRAKGSTAVVVIPKYLDLQNTTNVVTALRRMGCASVRVVVEGWGLRFPGPEM